jgi:hypothetical protein
MVTDGTFMPCDLSFTLVWEFIAGVPMHIPILSLTDYVCLLLELLSFGQSEHREIVCTTRLLCRGGQKKGLCLS